MQAMGYEHEAAITGWPGSTELCFDFGTITKLAFLFDMAELTKL